MDSSDFNKTFATQLIFINGWREDRDVICSCGHTRRVGYNLSAGGCPECGEQEVITVHAGLQGIATHSENRYRVVSKDDSHFHIERQSFLITATRGSMEITPTDNGELIFTMRDKKLKITSNGKNLSPTDASINTFFRGAVVSEVLNLMSTPRNNNLFSFCYNSLGKMGYERNKMWGRGLRRLREYPMVEVYGLSLLSHHLHSMWHGGFRSLLRSKVVQPPHKGLNIPKFLVMYVADMRLLSNHRMEKFHKLLNHFDGNSVRIIFEIFDEESDVNNVDGVVDTLLELHAEFGYKNLKRTVLYITREVKLEQGISSPSEAVTLLRDFARMSQAMEVSHTNYPKSLKKDHDIALLNYKAKMSEVKQKEFAKVVGSEDYATLEYKSKDLAIVNPSHVKDVINEGDSLSHCVASYVDDIIKKKCKIVFLRKTDNLEESLVTVEVRGDRIRQIRGRFNRKPEPHVLDFVRQWAKKKELIMQNY